MAVRVRRFSILIAVLALAAAFASPSFSGSRDNESPGRDADALRRVHDELHVHDRRRLRQARLVDPSRARTRSRSARRSCSSSSGPAASASTTSRRTTSPAARAGSSSSSPAPASTSSARSTPAATPSCCCPRRTSRPGATYTFQDLNQPGVDAHDAVGGQGRHAARRRRRTRTRRRRARATSRSTRSASGAAADPRHARRA